MHRLMDLPTFEYSIRETADALMAGPLVLCPRMEAAVASLDDRLAELARCSVPASEIEELAGLSPDVGHLRVLICQRLDDNAAGEFYPFEHIPEINGRLPSLACISLDRVQATPGQEGANAIALHELAHEYFFAHDLWFTTLQAWQRLQCGLRPDSLLGDCRDERRFTNLGHHRGRKAAAILAMGMAKVCDEAGLRRAEIVHILRQLKAEAAKDKFGSDAVALGRRLHDLIDAIV